MANITAGAETSHATACQKIMAENGEYCACIRRREIKSLDYNDEDICFQIVPIKVHIMTITLFVLCKTTLWTY